MLGRLLTALALAVLGSIATPGVSSAALLSDRDDVMIAVSLVAIGLMAILLVLYLIRHALGFDKMPAAGLDSHADDHH